MIVFINGKSFEFQTEISLKEAINRLQIEDKIMACALNLNVIKKDEWEKTILKDNDKIELLSFVGGG